MNVLDFKKDAGLWHGILTVSWASKDFLKHFVTPYNCNIWGGGWGPLPIKSTISLPARSAVLWRKCRSILRNLMWICGWVGVDGEWGWLLFLVHNRVCETFSKNLFTIFQNVMNKLHTISVPYSVMKTCPLSWVQRVHAHKGNCVCSTTLVWSSQENERGALKSQML